MWYAILIVCGGANIYSCGPVQAPGPAFKTEVECKTWATALQMEALKRHNDLGGMQVVGVDSYICIKR